MRLAVSNIAWDTAEDAEISALLARFDVNAIDVAPGKYFPDPSNATTESIAKVKNWWSARDVEITGMQALLFGTNGLNVFGSAKSQDAMLSHLADICRIGAGLGATRLVFGSPRNRDRTGLAHEDAVDVATSFFRRLGGIAQSQGVMICLEPNPPCYGANFMTTSAETAEVVTRVDHPAIRMQFDTGALTINREDPLVVLQHYAELIGHIHACEPGLVPLGDGATNHLVAGSSVERFLPSLVVAIEMLATVVEPHAASIERALIAAVASYRNNQSEVHG